MPPRSVLAAALVCLSVPRLAAAQDARDHVRWRAEPARVSAEGRAEVRLSGTVAAGWKLYSLTSAPPAPAMRVSLDTAGVRIDGAARHLRPPVAVFDSLLGVPVEQITGRADIAVPLLVAAGAAPDRVALAVRFAVCDASICLPPRTVRVVAPLITAPVATAPVATERAPAAVPLVPPAPVQAAPSDPSPEAPAARPSALADTVAPSAAAIVAADPSTAPSEPSPAEKDGPWMPRIVLGALVAAAVVRALLFATHRRRRPQG